MLKINNISTGTYVHFTRTAKERTVPIMVNPQPTYVMTSRANWCPLETCTGSRKVHDFCICIETSFDYNYQDAFRCNLCNVDLCHAPAILHKRKDTEYNSLRQTHSGSCSQITSSCKCSIVRKDE